MSGFTCIYLHGFLSSGQSHKGQWMAQKVALELMALAKGMPSNTVNIKQVITPTYPIASPQASVAHLEAVLAPFLTPGDLSQADLSQTNVNQAAQAPRLLLMGSSMGGFYAQYLGQKYGIAYVMINPALAPVPILSAEKGEHINPATGESFCIDEHYCHSLQAFDVKTLNTTIPALLLMDEADEVIDVPLALARYASLPSNRFTVCAYAGGNHAFCHLDQAWLEIKRFVNKL